MIARRLLTSFLLLFVVISIFARPMMAQTSANDKQARVTKLLGDIRTEDRRLRKRAAEELGRLGDERAVKPLIELLNDTDQYVAAAAAIALGDIKDPQAGSYLLEKLNSRSAELRGAAALALGRLANRNIASHLIMLLSDSEAYPRTAAATALGRLGEETALPNLIILLDRDAEVSVRTAAAEALGHIGDRQATAALVRALRAPSNYVRTAVAAALGELGGEAVAPPLIEALKDPDRLVRAAVADALGSVKDSRAVRPLIEALGDPDPYVRTNVAYALGKIGDRQAVEPLLEAANFDDPRVKNRAIDSLGAIGDSRALPLLLDILQDKDRLVRTNAINALAKIGDKRAVDSLLPLLADSDTGLRRASVEALGKIADTRAFESLANLVKADTDLSVRISALIAVNKVNSNRAITVLLDNLKANAMELRNTAATLLSQQQDAQIVPAIVGLLAQVDLAEARNLQPTLRLFFDRAPAATYDQLRSLLQTGNLAQRQQALLLNTLLARTQSSADLVAALQDTEAEMRALAAFLLGETKDRRNVVALRAALQDRDENVRQIAGRSLDTLGVPRYEPPTINNNTLARGLPLVTNPTAGVASGTAASTPPPPVTVTPDTVVAANDLASNATTKSTATSPNDSVASNQTANNQISQANNEVAREPQIDNQPDNSRSERPTTTAPISPVIVPGTPSLSDRIAANRPTPTNRPSQPPVNINSRDSRADTLANTGSDLTAGASTSTNSNINSSANSKVAGASPNNQVPENAASGLPTDTVAINRATVPVPAEDAQPTPRRNLELLRRNEQLVTRKLRELYTMQQQYLQTQAHYASLAELLTADLIDPELAKGEFSGYEFTLYISPATAHRSAKFFVVAAPLNHGQTGEQAFFIDETGVLRANRTTTVQVGQVYGSWEVAKN
jgi:HEAT repeat protein